MDFEQDSTRIAARQPQRRSALRLPLDEDSVFLIVGSAAPSQARLADLSLEGCRLRTQGASAARAGQPIEVFFRVNGVPFRLAGVVQWTDGCNLLGIHFANMLPRRVTDLAGVIAEIHTEGGARSATLRLLKPKQKSSPVAVRIISVDAQQKPSEAPVPHDRRSRQRQEIDTTASILLVKIGSTLRGHILDLSLDGCRIRTLEPFPVGIYTRVETEFRLFGLPFRLSGVVQSIHDRSTIGIRFLDLSERKREQVLDLIGEIQQFQAARPAEGRAAE